MAYPYGRLHVYCVPNNDCDVHRTCCCACVRGIQPQKLVASQFVRYVLLTMRCTDDLCRCLGLRKLFHKSSASCCHDLTICRSHVPFANDPNWLFLACSIWYYAVGLCSTFHHQLSDRYLQ